MKKTAVVVMLMIFSTVPLFCDVTADTPYSHYILGSVRSTASFSVTLSEEVFPFDLDSVEVAYNGSYTDVIHGLRIGEYTMVTNSSSIRLCMTHTPLVLEGTDGSPAAGKLRKIDYRLYAVIEDHGVSFSSCLSDANAISAGTATNRIEIPGIAGMKLVNKSLYVSLDEGSGDTTAASIENLKSGTYKSYVYFLLEGE